MDLTTLNSKTYRIEKNKRQLAEIRFPSVWSRRAEGEVPSGEIQILSDSTWGSKYHYLLNEVDRGHFRIDIWSGKTLIEVIWDEDQKPITYRLKSKWTGSKFILLDDEEQEILIIRAKMSWRRLCYVFDLEWKHRFEDEDQAAELAVYALHAARVKLAMQSG